MRKVLFFLLLLSSASIWGQIAKEVQFDFANPSSLNGTWKIPDPDSKQTKVDITNSTATAGAIKLSFSTTGAAGFGAQCMAVDNSYASYILRVSASTYMTFAATNGAAITEIRFSDDSDMGTLKTVDGQAGELDYVNTMRRLWQCAGNYDIHSVTYFCNGKEGELKKVVIKYLDPVNVLDAVSTSLPSSGSLTSFNEMSLTFASAMTVEAADKIYIEDASGKKQPVTVVSKDKVVTISVTDALQDGDYKVVIPAGSLKNPEGYCNKDLQYSFTVNTPKNILIYDEVTPATGKVEILQSGIVMSFDKPVKVVKTEAMLYKDGEEWSLVNIARKTDDSKAVVLTFDIPEGLTEDGVYTIVIPEHAIENQTGKLYNPELVLEYTIGGTTPDEPDEPDVPEDSDVMKAAKALLEKAGVGYPAVNSEARTELDALTTAEEVPADEALTAAMDKFYKESDVELPVAGKYYKIATKNEAADTLYLKYDKTSFVLVADKADATAFETEAAEGAFSFKTADGKYVAVNGVTDDAVSNQIKIEKINIENVDAVKLFGCVSLYGFIEKDVLDNEKYGYALMKYDTKAYGAMEQLYFNANLSSAFILEESEAQAIEATPTDVKYELAESVLSEDNNVIEVTFPEINDIKVVNAVKAYIVSAPDDTEDKKLCNVTVVLDEKAEKKNAVKAACPDLKKGKYYLVLPEGQILYNSADETYTNKKTVIEFEWNVYDVSTEFIHDYDYFYRSPNKVTAVDVELNELSIGWDSGLTDGFFADKTKIVELWQLDSGRMVNTGHFEETDGLPDVPECKKAYKLVLDKPIKSGDLRVNDKYTFVIPVATFGDKNFGAYLSGDAAVAPSQCHVNPVVEITYHIIAPTGITNIENGDSEKVIYTITGRRVNEMSAPGIYIVNGKKIIKK